VRYQPSRTGVCVVRIETQPSGVLITLRENPDIEQVSTERAIVVTDVDAAVEAVRDFLRSFVAASPSAEQFRSTWPNQHDKQ
jgi:hypothetical protein